MKKKIISTSAFFNPRTLLGLAICIFGFVLTLFAAGVLPSGTTPIKPVSVAGAKPGSQRPDIVTMRGPVSQDKDLRLLPYIPPSQEEEEVRRVRHPFPLPSVKPKAGGSKFAAQIVQSAMTMNMPSPLMSFDGIDSNLSGCNCLPPDSDGDVGSNNYVASMNSSIAIYGKSGNLLVGPVTYNSFFSALGTSTPCGNNQNDGDGIVFYDHIADRWVISDFAFPASGATNYQCIGVAKTSDPVAGGWYLYAVQIDPANPTWIGDYPKFGVWPDAYYLSVNLFDQISGAFEGVRMFAFNRSSMINGGSTNAISFAILPADLGDQYSLVPATFRTGAPPANQPEWFMSVNSSAVAGTVETQVFVRRFHVDFVTPANSTFGVGATTHSPDGIITVNGFVDAFTGGGTLIVPQPGTPSNLDTLGDKLMYPLVYQNINGKEFVYADQTILLNYPNGPTAVRWYQFDMTGNTVPATATQQQDWSNNNDGLYRWMPSINVDGSGNMAIGYSASSTTVNPGIRYAGRLSTDPPNTLGQGEAIMWQGTGHQTDPSGRWGDYTALFVDPTDNCTFWHTNEYYSVTGGANWRNRVGTFKLSQCTGSPPPTPTPTATGTPTPTPTATPTPTPTPGATPTPSPTPPASAGNVTITATAGTAGPTGYATVQAAFAAINLGTHQGAINVWVMADTTEVASASLSASGVGSASYTSVLLLPNGTRTVSGNLAAPLINLDGADNVRIDGYNQMTLSNTSTSATAGTSTIRFISSTAAAGGAQNNVVANCNIQGSSTAAEGAAGGAILFSTTTASGTNIVGNNNNVIANNNIGPAGANLPIKAITGLGTAGNNTRNTGNIITNNNIFDFFIATASTTGIDLRAGNTNWTISNNRIYQTAARTFTTAASRYAGITFSGTTGATGDFNTISGNTIGFGAANGTGTTTITGSSNEFRGIDILGASGPSGNSGGTATSVQGNIISGINQTSSRASTTTGLSAFAGIQVATIAGASATAVVDIGTVTGNTIGSLDGSSTVVINATSTTASTTPVFGILAFSNGSDFVNNNKIGAITIQSTGTVTGFRGIFDGASAATTHTVNNNTIGGAVAGGAITDTQVGSYAMYGIQTSTAGVSINGNTIRNLNGNSNGPNLVVGGGIAYTSTSTTAVTTISRNVISNLTNNSATATNSIYAIDLTFPVNAAVTANLVERNFIHSNSITSTDNTCQIWGIVNRGAASGTATGTIQNNMIRLGIDSAGNSITGGFSIIGIRDIQGAGTSAMNYYFNSVYIGGTGVVSTVSNTFAFNSSVTNTRIFRDNIFWNARSNASGAGKNYAITVAGTAPNPAGLTTNNNDLYATGTGGFVGLFNAVDDPALSDWKTATGQDANSISADPLFVNPNGSAATVDLHIQAGSPAIGAGSGVATTPPSPLLGVTNDFDNDTRNACTGDIGADEVVSFVGPVLSITKTADASSVVFGSQIGFTVFIANTGSSTATGLVVTDNLPAGSGVNWSIDGANTDAGWSVSGSPPTQSLVYSPTTLAAGATTRVHVVSSTTAGSCGSTLTNTASVTAANSCLHSASASISVGSTSSTVSSENFDGVTAPALPAGWTAANASGPAPLWVTNTTTPDTAPNDAFVDDPAVVSDKQLTSTTFAIPSNPSSVSFRNNYNLESTFDGGVLEISINGGAFADIITAGGSFVTGGYTGTVNATFSNPLAGRSAWTGSSNGYITSTVNFPAAAQGQNIKLRWRMGSDNSTAGTGWRVDTVTIQTLNSCPPLVTSVVSRMTHGGAGTFNLPLSTSSRIVEMRDGSGNFAIVFTFNTAVNSGTATFTGPGGGSVGSVTFSGNSMTVNLTGVTDQQTATVTVNNVSGPGTAALPSASTQIGFLIGDVTQDATVNVGDTIQVRNNAGVTLDNTNFKYDVNVDGFVNVGDTIVVRARSGDFLP